METIRGRDSKFELQKFRVFSKTGEVREQLGLAGVQIGDRILFSDFDNSTYICDWIVETEPVADADGVLSVIARPI
jgi:hypothetical protein